MPSRLPALARRHLLAAHLGRAAVGGRRLGLAPPAAAHHAGQPGLVHLHVWWWWGGEGRMGGAGCEASQAAVRWRDTCLGCDGMCQTQLAARRDPACASTLPQPLPLALAPGPRQLTGQAVGPGVLHGLAVLHVGAVLRGVCGLGVRGWREEGQRGGRALQQQIRRARGRRQRRAAPTAAAAAIGKQRQAERKPAAHPHPTHPASPPPRRSSPPRARA